MCRRGNQDPTPRQRRLEPPAEPFRVELTLEDETWSWGPVYEYSTFFCEFLAGF